MAIMAIMPGHGSGAAHRSTSLTRGLRVCTGALTEVNAAGEQGAGRGAERKHSASRRPPPKHSGLGLTEIRQACDQVCSNSGPTTRDGSGFGGAAQASAGSRSHRAGWYTQVGG